MPHDRPGTPQVKPKKANPKAQEETQDTQPAVDLGQDKLEI